MKRFPVTTAGVKGLQQLTRRGVMSPGVTTGAMDISKARMASKIQKHISMGVPRNPDAAGLTRTAGMMMEYNTMPRSYSTSPYGGELTSYATGNADYGSGARDIPTYFIMMNQQNGGVLYWPVSLKEKYEWYRYFCRTDAYVGRAMELLTDLPMSKITLHMPKMKDKQKQEDIHKFFTHMCERIGLFQNLQHILWELNMIGNVYAFHEWDAVKKMWSRIVILPPEEVNSFSYPFSDNSRIDYRPEKLIALIRQAKDNPQSLDENEFLREMMEKIPSDIIEMVAEKNCIVMDSEPIIDNQIGSFTFQFARRRSPYLDMGASVLERILVPMLMKENFRYTQLSLATRNMTPKNKISAPGLSDPELDDLRAQIDLSYMDPDYSVVTNYDWSWDQIGAEGRLLDLQGEYEMIENQVFAGLGVTRELLTGEGTYSGNRITVEILNTIFMLTREMLINYTEKKLFLPVAEANGWFEVGKFGIKEYFYPKVGFNRLSIRDNQEVFENLFQLYQKGSMPIDIILELFNLDSDRVSDQVRKDLFTIKDPTFNRALENVNDEAGRQIVERTDVVDRISKYLGLKITQPSAPPEGGAGIPGMDGGEAASGAGEDTGFGESAPDETVEDVAPSEMDMDKIDSMADVISDEIPSGATTEEVKSIVEKIAPKLEEKTPEAQP